MSVLHQVKSTSIQISKRKFHQVVIICWLEKIVEQKNEEKIAQMPISCP